MQKKKLFIVTHTPILCLYFQSMHPLYLVVVGLVFLCVIEELSPAYITCNASCST